MEHSYQNSTISQIIDAIIDQLSFEGESKSDIADILLSILNQTPYEKEPDSVIAELFIKLKAKIEGESFEPFDKPYISNIAEIIKSILDETEYNNAPNSRIAELLLELKEELEAYVEKTVSGAIANFTTSLALPLVSCEVDENATKVYQRGGNLWNEQWEIGTIATGNGQDSSSSTKIRSVGYTEVKPNVEYTYASANGCNVFFYQDDFTFISYASPSANKTFTTPNNCKYIRFTPVTSYGTTYNNDISIRADKNTFYEAYNSNSADYDVADIENIITFVGVNNIFTDNGDVSITYKAKETD